MMRGPRIKSPQSLTGRLLGGLVLPLGIFALLLGLGGALVIQASVQAVNDRILGAASRAIAESLAMDEGQIALNLSPAIFGMLEDNERDNVYYSVRHGKAVLTGYPDLPDIAPRGLRDLQVHFGSATYRGHEVRIVAEGRRLPGLAEPLVIQVAETIEARERIARRLLVALALLEGMLIALALLLLPLAVRWGMVPLRRLSAEMDRRAGADLTPLPTNAVPTELRDLVRAFNDMLARLDGALQSMRRFTADASHQMRTPLSILRTHIALLKGMVPPTADARESLEDIDQASARLQHLLVQLLALARADHAITADVPLAQVDLVELARTVAAEHAPAAVQEGVELAFEGEEPVPTIQTQPALAGELLSNLVDNAIRYNRAGGRVCVEVERRGNEIVASVEDDGPGIAAADRERVFDRFTRLDRDASRTGSGLGLPIARMLAGAIGARLTLGDGRNGRGLRAEVAFYLPQPTDS